MANNSELQEATIEVEGNSIDKEAFGKTPDSNDNDNSDDENEEEHVCIREV